MENICWVHLSLRDVEKRCLLDFSVTGPDVLHQPPFFWVVVCACTRGCVHVCVGGRGGGGWCGQLVQPNSLQPIFLLQWLYFSLDDSQKCLVLQTPFPPPISLQDGIWGRTCSSRLLRGDTILGPISCAAWIFAGPFLSGWSQLFPRRTVPLASATESHSWCTS